MEGFTYHYFPGFNNRYVGPQQLDPALQEFKDIAALSRIGASVGGRPIYGLEVGTGGVRVLMWSQMHGNESTTTRSLLDLLQALRRDKTVKKLLSGFTLFLIPMLNPDGAHAYTRKNANDVDLNRDAQSRTQPEIQALFHVFEDFKPHYCFNLHDQRSRYGVGDPAIPATLSVLAPAADSEGSITPARHQAMAILGEMCKLLLAHHPIGIGRYDDSFNANCVGDAITALGIPTFLIEAGFYPGDYVRERTREFVYFSVLQMLEIISTSDLGESTLDSYFELPENSSCFVDIYIKNAFPNGSEGDGGLYLNYEEQLVNGSVHSTPARLAEEYASTYKGHVEYDWNDPADKKRVLSDPGLQRFFE